MAPLPSAILEFPEPEAREVTRERILDQAETLFARHGVDKVSLRAITAAAEANVAAIHYHFGTKEDLLRAIFIRRMTPLLDQRQKRLEEYKSAQDLDLESLLSAYIQPAFDYDCAENDFGFHRLIARLSYDNTRFNSDVFYFIQNEHNKIFLEALSGLLPELSADELVHRLDLVVGLIVLSAVGRMTRPPRATAAIRRAGSRRRSAPAPRFCRCRRNAGTPSFGDHKEPELAPVERRAGSRDVGRSVGEHEANRLRHLLGLPGAVQRCARRDPPRVNRRRHVPRAADAASMRSSNL